MILSDRSIKERMMDGNIVVDPLGPNAIQPASVDIRLDREVLIFRNSWRTHIDVMQPADDVVERVQIEDDRPFILHRDSLLWAARWRRSPSPMTLWPGSRARVRSQGMVCSSTPQPASWTLDGRES